MYVVRETMHCKPGKVRPMVQKTLAMAKLMGKSGLGTMRVLTDLAGERYWTIVMELETPSLQAFDDMMQGKGQSEADTKEFERLMEGYHDLIDSGHREIYRLEPATKG